MFSDYNGYCLLRQVEIDRRMLDFCVGLDTEFSEVVEGSHLYFPKTKFEHVRIDTQRHIYRYTYNGHTRMHTHAGIHLSWPLPLRVIFAKEDQPPAEGTRLVCAK